LEFAKDKFYKFGNFDNSNIIIQKNILLIQDIDTNIMKNENVYTESGYGGSEKGRYKG